MIDVKVIREIEVSNLTFPECIDRLRKIGIERYNVDFVHKEKIFYSTCGMSYSLPVEKRPISIVHNSFNKDKIIDALRMHQKGETDYDSFVESIVSNGCCSYAVFVAGKKVVYTGRFGEVYIEHFPF